MNARILVAEDDPKQGDLIRRYLEREGHAVAVVRDGRAAVEAVRRIRPDLLVLDVMMPALDGLDVCRMLRTERDGVDDLPIIMVTARSTEDDLLLGLDLGADDYLTKPYSPRVLVARVRAVLRRSRAHSGDEVCEVGALTVDQARHEVRFDGQMMDLTPAEFKLLACLARAPGRAFSRQQLLEGAFGFGHYVLDRTVDVHVMNLRRKLERYPGGTGYLVTVYGVGYKLADPPPGTGAGRDRDDESEVADAP